MFKSVKHFKALLCMSVLFSGCLSTATVHAQSAEWNHNGDNYQTGEIQLRDGAGNVIDVDINEMGTMSAARSAPLLVRTSSGAPDYPVRLTSTRHRGNFNTSAQTGTQGGDAICANEFAGYKMCGVVEVARLARNFQMPSASSILNGITEFSTVALTSGAWMQDDPANTGCVSCPFDCNDWKSSSSSFQGRLLTPYVKNNYNDIIATQWSLNRTSCNNYMPIMCCAE